MNQYVCNDARLMNLFCLQTTTEGSEGDAEAEQELPSIVAL